MRFSEKAFFITYFALMAIVLLFMVIVMPWWPLKLFAFAGFTLPCWAIYMVATDDL